jgi:alanine-synthesizing transaminase
MEFRRINALPPYVLASVNALTLETRRAGRDVIDLGFGNPDLPSPDIAVEKLAEAAHNPKNHRYSSSRGIPKLRQAIANRYQQKFGVEIDPDTEVVPVVPDPHLRAALRRGRRAPGPSRRPDRQ